MKIERINENQIRCTLNNIDLSTRNLNLTELAYGTDKAKNLFREMIQKASSEVGFEADDIPLMVEAIPLSSESVMLVITKIEDPEELDTRFAKFSPMSEDEDSLLNSLANELLEGAESLLQYLKTASDNVAVISGQGALPQLSSLGAEGAKEHPEPTPADQVRIFTFSSLDQASDAAKVVEPAFDGESTLYKNPHSGQYYLLIRRKNESLEFSKVCNILAEYGAKIHHDYATEAYYEEHYDTVIPKHAIQALSQF